MNKIYELQFTNSALRTTFFVLIVIYISAVGIFAQSPNGVVVRVATEKTVDKDVIKLGDVAEIFGESETVARLQSISLGYAPNFGAIREIARERILLAVSATGLAENEFSFEAPPVVRVNRIGQVVPEESLRASVEKTISELFQNNGVTANITKLELPSNIIVPTGTVEICARASNVRNFAAPFTVAIEIKINARVVRRFSVATEIKAFADVLVANRDLTANSKISETDVKLENRLLTKPLANYIREFKNLRGAVLLNNLTAGTEITAETVAPGVVIKAGDTVRVIGQSGKLQIVISGEARAAGRIGDRISIKNSQSGIILQAYVIDEGVVQVRF